MSCYDEYYGDPSESYWNRETRRFIEKARDFCLITPDEEERTRESRREKEVNEILAKIDEEKVLKMLKDAEEQSTYSKRWPSPLEDEIKQYFKGWDMNSHGAFFNEEGFRLDDIGVKNIARHFYELGQKNGKEEWWNKGYLKGREDANKPAKEVGLPKRYDQESANENVVYSKEGTVTSAGGEWGYDVVATRLDDSHVSTILVPHEEGRKYGDKVKIVITKED